MLMSNYVYVCAAGESFDSIALEIWRDEKYASELMCANPEQCGKAVFTGNETLYVPVVNVPDEQESPAAASGGTAPWKE